MKADELKKLFKTNSMVTAGKDLVLYDDLELYNVVTGETKQFKTLDEAVEELGEDLTPIDDELNGGRGQRSNRGKRGEPKGSPSKSYYELPSALWNNQGRFSSTEKTIDDFTKQHAKSPIEYSLTIDNQGFVHAYNAGNKGSVAVTKTDRAKGGATIIHNHPNGSSFSDADLRVFAKNKNINTMIATNPNGKTHRITKEKGFNPKGFDKFARYATNVAWFGGSTAQYNKSLARILNASAKEYGFKYEYR